MCSMVLMSQLQHTPVRGEKLDQQDYLSLSLTWKFELGDFEIIAEVPGVGRTGLSHTSHHLYVLALHGGRPLFLMPAMPLTQPSNGFLYPFSSSFSNAIPKLIFLKHHYITPYSILPLCLSSCHALISNARSHQLKFFQIPGQILCPLRSLDRMNP